MEPRTVGDDTIDLLREHLDGVACRLVGPVPAHNVLEVEEAEEGRPVACERTARRWCHA